MSTNTKSLVAFSRLSRIGSRPTITVIGNRAFVRYTRRNAPTVPVVTASDQ